MLNSIYTQMKLETQKLMKNRNLIVLKTKSMIKTWELQQIKMNTMEMQWMSR